MKIGLIAMSGIRIVDPDLLSLGLTLPGVIERGNVIAALPSLGLLTLAGMTPDEHEVVYIEVQDLDAQNNIPKDLDLAAISTLTPQANEAFVLAAKLKTAGITNVIGGLFATSLPELCAQHFDAVVVGEGETQWLQVLQDVQHGRLQEIYRAGDRSFNLAESPMPRYELIAGGDYNRITVQTSRGCPLKCEFCAGSILLTPKYKQKPIERVLAEIDHIKTLWKRPFIELADDNSFCNRRYWMQLLPELAKRKIRWFTETDIAFGEDSELLELARAAGCVEVLIGLESPDEDSLGGLELKTNWKHRHWSSYRECVHNIQSHGIAVNGCFILGLDNHTPEIFDLVYEAAENLELFDVQVTVQTAFPGTPLYDRLNESGRLIEPEAWEKCTLFDVNFYPEKMTVEELRVGFHNLVARLYVPDALANRRDRFRRKYFRPV